MLRIWFLKYKDGGTLVERLVTKAVKDVSSVFGISRKTNVGHVIVAIDETCWEVTLDGTVRYESTKEELQSLPRVLGYYELDISNYANTNISSLRWVLNGYIGKKLPIASNLLYAFDVFCAFYIGFDGVGKMSLDSTNTFAKVNNSNNLLDFSLPFTCCTPANTCLQRLLEYELNAGSHLPTSLLISCLELESMNIGELVFTGQIDVLCS